MKKTINIFVAGAKDLKNERNALKALAHELNTSYEDRKININLKIRSYEDFRDNQIEYNNFIENEAEVAIFVLKDRIGKHTEEEFINAASAYNRKKIPEIIVFLNKDRKETQEVAHIQELLQEHLGNHYFVEYSDDDDLKAKARKRIDRFIRPTFRMNSRATIWALTLTTLCACIFAGLFIWTNYFRDKEKSLLFAGGGSVINFIQAEQGDANFLIDYPNSVCAYVSSKTAWKLLPEEFNRNKYQNGKLKYNTICLSADKMPRDSITKLIEPCTELELQNEGRIIEVYLGEDPLVVYIKKDLLRTFSKDNSKFLPSIPSGEYGTISPEQLDNIIKANYKIANIFSTSSTSGTCSVFQKSLKEKNSNCIDFSSYMNEQKIKLYTEALPLDSICGANIKPYIVLGSEYYKISELDENDYSKFHIKGSSYNSKELYLYFVAFRIPNTKNKFYIPSSISEFLNNFKPKNKKTFEHWEEVKKIINNDTITVNNADLIHSIPNRKN